MGRLVRRYLPRLPGRRRSKLLKRIIEPLFREKNRVMNPTPTDAKEESLFHQTIAQLAYYLYVLRGCKEGRDMNNWIEEETQLKSRVAVNEGVYLQAGAKIIEA